MIQPDAPQPKTAEELGVALTRYNPKFRLLADNYLATFNKRKAGLASGYSEASKKYLLPFHRADMQAYISARLAEMVMSADEVLARLSQRASLDASDFFERESYEVPVFEARPLQEKIDHLEHRVGQLNAIDPGLLKQRIEDTQAQIAGLQVDLALDPEATYQVQVGTETRYRMIPSLEAAERNGVLQFAEGAEYGPNGLKFKWADPVKALELIGKHHKLFTDKVEHSGAVEVIGIDFIMPEGTLWRLCTTSRRFAVAAYK